MRTRFQIQDKCGFAAGDVSLYRYVGNDPTNAIDPSGLWTWELGPRGQIFAVTEKDDTLNGLIRQGYAEAKLLALAKASASKLTDRAAKLAAGIKLDLSEFLPAAARKALERQQSLDFEKLRARVENSGGPKNVPQGKTLGTSGITLMQKYQVDEKGRVKTRPYADNQFGLGNCYGFIGLFLGQQPPTGVPPENYGLGSLKREKEFGEGVDKPGIVKKDWGKQGGLQAMVYPENGLLQTLIKGRQRTNTPGFGAIALFKTKTVIGHAALVLGRSQQGKVYVVQKLNMAEPYAVSTVTDPFFEGYVAIEYYR